MRRIFRKNPLMDLMAKQDPEGFREAVQKAAAEVAKEFQEHNAKLKAKAEEQREGGV
ncbi:MAG: hypothetical protein Q8P05_02810 [Candidatus Diapherotrites archaeon]|nr:hypothetical protein [Candidatus Diapherotrites archaeon]